MNSAEIEEVLANEGGYANDPRDAGGETMFGITKAVARADGYTGPEIARSAPSAGVRHLLPPLRHSPEVRRDQ
ncbi:glycosyl hydrolase 108 family protein [Sphingomonas sp. MMS24-JH45]